MLYHTVPRCFLARGSRRCGSAGHLLDTGASTTIVRRDLVPEEKITGEEISIRCAHGDTIVYPLAEIEIGIGGRSFTVEAAVVEKLPVSVLLGRDVPELVKLLQEPHGLEVGEMQQAEAMAVTTRAQKKRQEEIVRMEESGDRAEPNRCSGQGCEELESNHSKPETQEGGILEAAAESIGEMEVPGTTWDDDLFAGGTMKTKLSRRQKRAGRAQFRKEEGEESTTAYHPLDLTSEELKQLQEEDESLEEAWKAAQGRANSAGSGFFEREGLLYRRWVPLGRDGEDMAVDQLVLPRQCRGTVVQLAHAIPMAGHMGKNKTAQRIHQ